MKARMIPRIALASILVLVAGATSASAAEKAGDVVAVRGKALIERQAKKVDATVRAALMESDSVQTRERSRVKMLFRDDSVLTLGANSRLNIKKYLSSPDAKRAESIYELADGSLRSVVGGPGFKVVTPTALAAARGTVFTVSYDRETGSTEITVLEGTVEVRNVNAEIAGVQIVSAGQSTTVSSDRAPTQPQPAAGGQGDQGGDIGGVPITPPGALGGGGGAPALLEELAGMTAGGLSLAPPIEQEPLQAQGASRVLVNIAFPR